MNDAAQAKSAGRVEQADGPIGQQDRKWSSPRRVAAAVLWESPYFTAVVLGVLCFLIFLTPRHWWNTSNSGDVEPNVLLPIAILHNHALDFDRIIQQHPSVADRRNLPYWFSERYGRVVSFYPIVPGLMNLPAFMIADSRGYDLFRYRFILSHLTSCVVSALAAGFMFLALDAICTRRPVAIAFTLLFALGTEVWGTLTEGMWQHGPSILLLSAALAIVLRRWRWGIPLAGVLMGLAIWNRPTNVLLVAPLAVYVILTWRRQAVAFICAMAVPLLLLAIYSYLYCGSVIYLGQGRNMEVDLSTTGHGGWLRAPFETGIVGELFSPNRGLLVFTPIFAAGFAFLIYATLSRRERPIFRYLLAGVLLSLWCYGHWFIWWGGWSWGYRILSELIPFLILATAMAWERWLCRWRITRWSFIALALWGVYVQSLGAYYFRYDDFNAVPNNIDRHPERVWDIKEGEIARDQRKLWADIGTLLTWRLPKVETVKPQPSDVK